MAYSAQRRAQRRCTATRRDGSPCRCYAVWNDPTRRCWRHGGSRAMGRSWREERGYSRRRRHAPICRCGAFAFPHRPWSRGAGGECRWPEEPAGRCSTRQGSRSAPRRAAALKGVGIAKRTARRRQAGLLPAHGPAPDPNAQHRAANAAYLARHIERMARSRHYWSGPPR